MNFIILAVLAEVPDKNLMTEIDGEPWIIKFPAHVDGKDAGKNGIRLCRMCEKHAKLQ